jgi:hypothetical protein
VLHVRQPIGLRQLCKAVAGAPEAHAPRSWRVCFGRAYRLHREKVGRHFLFIDIDWVDHAFHGTTIA